MSYQIETGTDKSVIEWLDTYGTRLGLTPPAFFYHKDGEIAVCLTKKSDAYVMWSQGELEAFKNGGEEAGHIWYYVPKHMLLQIVPALKNVW